MATFPPANAPRFIFKAGSIELLVVDFSIREKISDTFEVQLSLASEDEVKFDTVIGKTALLTLESSDEARYVHGIIDQFAQTGLNGRFYLYRARVVPQIKLLALEQDCRIFQQQSVPDIVKAILQESGITSDLFKFRLQGQYSPREYCVQYRETDLNFISRLLEEEGIFYFFEHSQQKHLLVFGDGTVNYQPIAGQASIPFNPGAGMVAEAEAVVSFQLTKQIRSGKYTLRDFNFERPSLNLTVDQSASEHKKLEVYDYPGDYLMPEEGERIAQVRLQQTVMYQEKAEGRGVVSRLLPGFTFKLSEHDIPAFNQEYLLIEVFHSGAQPQVLAERAAAAGGTSYENHFVAIPSAITIRPEIALPKPIVEGVQTATVTGPAGEEIYTDQFGRVKVLFHWDRLGKKDEKSSCWIWVSQSWAGAGWGAMHIPRIGQEVIVDFIEGDPDRPIITGRVYHGGNKPPYSLPAEKTKSTVKSNSTTGGGGDNEIRFEDKKGQEEIYIHGQKDWNTVIGNNTHLTIGHNHIIEVANDEVHTISHDHTHEVRNNRSRTVGKDETVRIAGNKSEMVVIASTETVGAAKALTVGAGFQISVGGGMNTTVGGLKSVQVGGALLEAVGAQKSSKVAGNESMDVGKNLTVTIAGEMKHTVSDKRTDAIKKDYLLKAQKVTIQAEKEIEIVTGSAQLLMKKNGDIEIKGKKISIKGSGDVIVKGSNVKEN
ncbi:MAG: type VI secretion system tip protein TssI/VgrG [Desulfobacteraceae bacterium]|nr:type VI secretion system tip protein TssI/VgrG [Desulfobacteraceae bacterium]